MKTVLNCVKLISEFLTSFNQVEEGREMTKGHQKMPTLQLLLLLSLQLWLIPDASKGDISIAQQTDVG